MVLHVLHYVDILPPLAETFPMRLSSVRILVCTGRWWCVRRLLTPPMTERRAPDTPIVPSNPQSQCDAQRLWTLGIRCADVKTLPMLITLWIRSVWLQRFEPETGSVTVCVRGVYRVF